MKIYVGNIPYGMDDGALRSVFQRFGEVTRANVALDGRTGLPKGFGVVDMPRADNALEAIREMDGRILDGRRVKVVEFRRRGGDDSGSRKKERRRYD